MSKEKIIKIPITNYQRIKNERGNMSVNCIITDRWLKFSDKAHDTSFGKAFTVDVMTTNINGIDKKICQLVIVKEELIDVLKRIEIC